MSKNVKISNPMKVITGVDTRWSYANVWEPKSINGGTPKYSVSLIIPKSDTKTIAKIEAAIEAAYKEGEAKLKGNGKSVPALSVLKTPLRDGDAERPDDEAYKNAYFVNANATSAPGIVDADLNPILTRSEVYSGVYLERYGHDARIDHRSHAERGLVEQPTIHEGVVARAMEKKGIISDRCELNRQIKADNALLRELKAAVKKLAQEVLHSLPELAKSMEFLRQKLLIFCYQLNHIRTGKSVIGKSVDAWNINLNRYSEVVDQIKETKRERTDLLAEKKELPFWNIPRKNELTARIAELTELLEELQSEKAILLDNMDCTDGKDVSKVRKKVALMEANLKELDEQEQKYSAELETALAEYAELKTQGEQFDPVELHDTRQELRPEMEQTAVQRVKEKYGDKYSHRTMDDSKRDVSRHLDEYAESQEIRQIQREREYQQRRQNKAKQERKKQDDWER